MERKIDMDLQENDRGKYGKVFLSAPLVMVKRCTKNGKLIEMNMNRMYTKFKQASIDGFIRYMH